MSLYSKSFAHASVMGTFLGDRIVKAYPNEKAEPVLYLGTVVAYMPPFSDAATVQCWKPKPGDGRRALHTRNKVCSLERGLYRIVFDDGDVEDMDPMSVYDCLLAYHKQRQRCINKSSVTVMGKDQVSGARKTKSSSVNAEAGARELLRHANPSLRPGHVRSEVVREEALGEFMCYEDHYSSAGRSRPLPVTQGWSEGETTAESPTAKRKRGRPRTTRNVAQPNTVEKHGDGDGTKCASKAKRGDVGGDAGRDRLNEQWICPSSTMVKPSSDKDAVDCDEEITTLRLPSHQRLLTFQIDGIEHSFVLSVHKSSIPNAGRGLFLTYRGPDALWTVPGLVDLGLYGPHTSSDMKPEFLMHAKNFIFLDVPSEWSFRAPDSSSLCRIYGKEVNKEMLFDITDDTNGEVHKKAQKTLLPFVNEVTPTKSSRKRRRKRRQKQEQEQKQNVDATHHDDGTVHYLLKPDSVFTRDHPTELLVSYGPEYKENRKRKHAAYGGNKDSASDTPNSYTVMRMTIATYTEEEILAVLELSTKALTRSAVEPACRQRIYWIIEQMNLYMTHLLYHENAGEIPRRVKGKLLRVLRLFSPEDKKAMEKYRFLGGVIRFDAGASGFKTGIVERIAPSASRDTTSDDGDRVPPRYLVYFSGNNEEVLSENEVARHFQPNLFVLVV